MVVGYNVIAFNQIAYKRIDPKTHINELDLLLGLLRKRSGVIYLKRLTIVLDEDSEKGFGLVRLFLFTLLEVFSMSLQTNGNISLVQPYDILALMPTTQTTFSVTCLTHTLPSPLTAHIISLPLSLPRLPFHLKHTLVRTAVKNGAVFEIGYAGALGGESNVSNGGGDTGAGGKRNWWAAARELVRVTKGKGIITSGGVTADADLRAPRDICNL
jgi:ribonuclease P/MRP protein subunit RPP1